MTTKYAKAKDTAFQWRAEYRKVKEENKSLRRVLSAALAYIDVTSEPIRRHELIEEKYVNLKTQTRRVALAIGGE
jgi:hypothetical protein